jgi:glycosyltransferase involved in cell wall biosynthesis
MHKNSEEVLILSPFFFPEKISTGMYNTVLAEELLSRGYSVKVFASHPLYPDWKVKKSLAKIEGVTVCRGGAWLSYPRSALLRRALLEFWFSWFVLISYIRNNVNPIIVIAVFPPSAFILFLSWMLPRGVKTVGIVHDLQGVYAARSSGFIAKALKASISFVEKRGFASCEQLIFLSASMAKAATIEYALNEAKTSVCYPFANPSINEKSGAALLNHILPSEFINVVYSGALGDKQNPEGLFHFLNQLANKYNDVLCHIFSGGPTFEELKACYPESNGCKIKFHDLVATEQLKELYERSDIQVIPQAVGTSEGSLPSKLPNLLLAGVPILAICDEGSELGEIILEAKAGVVAYTWDIAGLIDSYSLLHSELEVELRNSRKERLQGFVKENFSIEKLADVILRGTKN